MCYNKIIKRKEITNMTLRLERDNEVVLISPYGFEWYVDTELARAGLVEDFEADVETLQDEGFELVN